MKQQIEQTEVEEEAPAVDAEEAEAVEAPEEEALTQQEDTSQEEETKPEVKEEPKAEKLYKLKVKGKEKEVGEDQLIALAQQGEDYNLKMANLKKWEEDLKQKESASPASPFGNMPIEKVNEFLIEELNKNPAMTLVNMMQMINEQKDNATKQERKNERDYKAKMAESFPELWSMIKSPYEDYREEGHSREAAFAMARADFYQDIANKAVQRGMEKGRKKAEARLKAEIPSGTKKTKISTGLPTPEQTKKMSSKEIAKYLKRTQNPGW
jgi:hypothetical protein